ncbi:hypothetical protein Bca4012_042326 [Brassica carinata]
MISRNHYVFFNNETTSTAVETASPPTPTLLNRLHRWLKQSIKLHQLPIRDAILDAITGFLIRKTDSHREGCKWRQNKGVFSTHQRALIEDQVEG